MADTIRALSEAEIRLWVLTGDKIETAITIGYNAAVRATLAHRTARARTHARTCSRARARKRSSAVRGAALDCVDRRFIEWTGRSAVEYCSTLRC